MPEPTRTRTISNKSSHVGRVGKSNGQINWDPRNASTWYPSRFPKTSPSHPGSQDMYAHFHTGSSPEKTNRLNQQQVSRRISHHTAFQLNFNSNDFIASCYIHYNGQIHTHKKTMGNNLIKHTCINNGKQFHKTYIQCTSIHPHKPYAHNNMFRSMSDRYRLAVQDCVSILIRHQSEDSLSSGVM